MCSKPGSCAGVEVGVELEGGDRMLASQAWICDQAAVLEAWARALEGERSSSVGGGGRAAMMRTTQAV